MDLPDTSQYRAVGHHYMVEYGREGQTGSCTVERVSSEVVKMVRKRFRLTPNPPPIPSFDKDESWKTRKTEQPDTSSYLYEILSLKRAEMGRRQCKSTYNNMKNKTSPESSPPPTSRPEHCNVDKAEENDLKNSLMKMIEKALEGKMKKAVKEIEEKTKKNWRK
ncbi:hypothetical protein STEG23_007181 [Scotinomys teguina]